MEEQNLNEDTQEVEMKTNEMSRLHQVTPLSKYLALALFLVLPFIGGWIGYQYAPEKVVEVEKFVIKEVQLEDVNEFVQNERRLAKSFERADDLLIEMFTCETSETPFPHSCFNLVERDTGKVVSADITKLARQQGMLHSEGIVLVELLYDPALNTDIVYFFTGIPQTDIPPGFVEFNKERKEFTTREDMYFGWGLSHMSSSNRYIASATNDMQRFQLVDLETGTIIFEDEIIEGSLLSTACSFAGSQANIEISEDETIVTYGVYSTEKIEGDECGYQLIETREFKIAD